MKEISKTAQISKLADIEDSVRGSKITIDDQAVIDSFVKIKWAGGHGDIYIGKQTYINSGTVIYSGPGVKIGNGVLIAANCTLAAANHEYRVKDKRILDQGFMPSKGGIVIEDDVWIERSVLKNQYIEKTVRKDGTVQPIRWIMPPPEGLDSIRPAVSEDYQNPEKK